MTPMPSNPETPRPLILVVEDEEIIRTNVAEILTDAGMRVSGFSDGEAFVASLAGSGEMPRALIVDVNLGGVLDGFDVARRARETWTNLPVVFVSGDLRPLVKLSGRHDICLMKPFSAEALVRVVTDL